ncbi:hypothetical protein GWK16_17340 [Roseomonas sp. JC162]|uniref:Uncharacterized protein n=1 Tax=Neoroseomonas marina TaxID=1232220 RepID=A0A848EGA2_9PROT|nr:hypothetical protein [Neoroseomonas marina]NMJ43016.1 hypothetical protein [Neoroseomonas marina]
MNRRSLILAAIVVPYVPGGPSDSHSIVAPRGLAAAGLGIRNEQRDGTDRDN